MSRAPMVCICGSLRFGQLMQFQAALETSAGRIVVMPHDTSTVRAGLDDRAREVLAALHREKIRRSDEVLVVGDYVGDDTRAEIAYARSLGKRVRFTHPEADPLASGR